MKITAHCLVKNEERFVWYSVMSVINHVDKILLWDTGSTDSTKNIIREIKKIGGERVVSKFLGKVTPETYTKVRQTMLDETLSDWFIVVDGDEIWFEESIKRVVNAIKSDKKKIESIVVPTINLIGDLYHYQEEAAGLYKLAGKKGHYALRAINRRIPGLSSSKPHGTWGWTDGEGRMIQNRSLSNIKFVNAPYLHTTFLARSISIAQDHKVPKRAGKLKYEIGDSFPKDYYYPEVFFRPKPAVVPNVWEPIDYKFKRKAFIRTPLKKVKRRILPAGVGY